MIALTAAEFTAERILAFTFTPRSATICPTRMLARIWSDCGSLALHGVTTASKDAGVALPEPTPLTSVAMFLIARAFAACAAGPDSFSMILAVENSMTAVSAAPALPVIEPKVAQLDIEAARVRAARRIRYFMV